jgi:serine/threonine-protein kinase
MGMSEPASGSEQLIAGKYRVEREIGKGGMGRVVAAMHVELEQRVAIKLLHTAAVGDPEATARFMREARAAARIHGEHVVRMIDVGTLDDGTAYIVMEYLDGDNLEVALRQRGALPVQVAVDWLLQACEGIAAAHAAGIVHRDLKPANLLLARQPDRGTLLKVLDFGISKVTHTESAPPPTDGVVTHTGQVFGSPHYMSPEQLRSVGHVDHRADIWALGAVLHEMLSGKPPFARSSMAEVLAAVMRDPPPPLHTLRPDVPEELSRIVLRCLEKEPEQRFADVRELAQALLPFGRKNAAERVERIARLLGGEDVPAEMEMPSPPPSSLAPGKGISTPGDTSTLGGGISQSPLASTVAASKTSVPLPEGRRRSKLVAAAAAATVISLSAFTIHRTSCAPQTIASGTPPSPSEMPAPAPAPSAREAEPRGTEKSNVAAAVTITIPAAPPGTKAYLGDTALGQVPGALRLPRGTEPVTLRFVAERYVPAMVELVPDMDRVLAVSLQPVPTAAPAEKPRPAAPVRARVPKDLEPF